jgi:hypothetical protein
VRANGARRQKMIGKDFDLIDFIEKRYLNRFKLVQTLATWTLKF